MRDSFWVELDDRDGDGGESNAEPSYRPFPSQNPVLLDRGFLTKCHGLKLELGNQAAVDSFSHCAN